MKVIAQGAEATIYEDENAIIKERKSKAYRHPTLDAKILKSRTKKEAKLLEKLKTHNVNVPSVIRVDGNRIVMEKIDGVPLKTVINDANQQDYMQQVGDIVSKMHSLDIIHGDLTTLNFLVKNGTVFIIDFGLGFSSTKAEDKAVDLYVFEKALKCAHKEEYAESFFNSYFSTASKEILNRLEKVRLRGRKREEEELAF